MTSGSGPCRVMATGKTLRKAAKAGGAEVEKDFNCMNT